MTSPADVLRSMFEHHLWATQKLIDHLEGLPGPELDAAIPGTYGSMIATLMHLVDADARYLIRLRESNPPPPAEDRVGIPLETLHGEMEDHGRLWNEALADLERGELTAVIRNSWYPDTDGAEGLLLGQAIHHGDDHRTQICSTLGALGLEVPDLDVWAFWATRRSA